MKAIIAIIALTLGGCSTLRIEGGFETPYGTVTSDGEVLRVKARLPGGGGWRK